MVKKGSHFQNTEIGDYDVPKGTMVIPLQQAIHTDPFYWHTEPLSFIPKRFITDDGSLAKPKAFLPFQTGTFTENIKEIMLRVIKYNVSSNAKVKECALAMNWPGWCYFCSLREFFIHLLSLCHPTRASIWRAYAESLSYRNRIGWFLRRGNKSTFICIEVILFLFLYFFKFSIVRQHHYTKPRVRFRICVDICTWYFRYVHIR